MRSSEARLTVNRIDWIDALRGLSMFFVVYYHLQTISIGVPIHENVLMPAVISFMIPVFFYISGFLAFKSIDEWNWKFLGRNFQNKSLQLLIPTIVFYVLWVLFLRQSSPLSYFEKYGFEGFWFTLVLFEFLITYYCTATILHYLKIPINVKGKVFDIVILVLGFIGVGILVKFHCDNIWWRSLCLTPYFRYLQFFMFGILCKKYSARFLHILTKDAFISVLICVFVGCLYFIMASSDIKTEYGLVGNLINDIVVRYAGVLIVVACFYKNRHIFEKDNAITKILILIGRRSLEIYMIHNFLLPQLSCFQPLFNNRYNFVLEFWILVILAMLIITFALMIGAILRNSRFWSILLLGVKATKPTNIKNNDE